MRFNIESLKERTGRVQVDDLDFDAFRSEPLSEPVLRCLRYMHDIEHHTICYLRDLLATPAHADHEVTTFLTMWNFEEYWHGEAIGRVLAAHGEPNGGRRVEAMRRSLRWSNRVGPTLHAVGSSLVGASYTAVHMTWG